MLETFALAASLATAAPTPDAEEIPWIDGTFLSAQGRARAEEKPLLVYVWASSSAQCARLYQETMGAEGMAAEMAPFLCYSAPAEGGDGRRVIERFGVETLPTLLFFTPDGAGEDAILGYIPPDPFVRELARIRRGEDTVSDFARRIAEDGDEPEDLEENLSLRTNLAQKLRLLGEASRADELAASILELDPKGATTVGGRALIERTLEQCGGDTDEESDVAEWDLRPLYALAKKIPNEVARFEAWQAVGNHEARARRPVLAVDAFAEAWELVPEEQELDWGRDVATWMLSIDRESDDGAPPPTLSKKEEKRIAKVGLGLAERVVAISEELGETVGDEDEGDGDDAPTYRFRGSREEYEPWLAGQLELLAQWQWKSGKERRAISTIERCCELDAENEEYAATLERFRDEA